MTDERLIAGIKYCKDITDHNKCDSCPMKTECDQDNGSPILNTTLDLITRQKAEIENNRKAIYSLLSIIDELEQASYYLDETNQKFEKAFEKGKNLVKEMGCEDI